MRKLSIILSMFLSIAATASEKPSVLTHKLSDVQSVPQIKMPKIQLHSILAKDSVMNRFDSAPKFAHPMNVNIKPATHGKWETLNNGQKVWRLRIFSEGALSLNLGFTKYHMPKDATLFVYSPDTKHSVGPFTSFNNHDHKQLWTPIVRGQEIVVELTIDAKEVENMELELTRVNHDYRGFGRKPIEKLSGSCNVDVVCRQGDDWQDEVRSVAVISTGGYTFCTGFMVNNTARDSKPYFMTAKHCRVNASNAASLVVYWNYQNSTCRDGESGPSNGNLDQFTTGSTFRASGSASDFTLLELNNKPDPAFNVYLAGWDRTLDDPTQSIAIHHPNTDEKRISFDYDNALTTSYLGNTYPGDGTHIQVIDWDVGTTEPGSSGSPLFNQDRRVVGQLHGGYAACGNDSADWYGRISHSWDSGNNASSRLKDWLDPLKGGYEVLDGMYIQYFQ